MAAPCTKTADHPRGGSNMHKVFICYRREDSHFLSDRIYEYLSTTFGRDTVFRDIDNIPAGVDFRQHVEKALKSCEVMLVVIGREWLALPNVKGQRRLDDANDFVRVEIEAALQKKIPIIPLLVQDARMPSDGDLPPSIASLAFFNARQVRADPDFRHDIEGIIQGITRHVPLAPRRRTRRQVLIGGAIGAATLGGLAVLASRRPSTPAAPTATATFTPPTLAPGSAIFCGSPDGPVYAARASDGAALWRHQTLAGVNSSPVVVGGVVYVGSADRTIYALRAADGKVLWRYLTKGAIFRAPGVVDGVVYVGSTDRTVYA